MKKHLNNRDWAKVYASIVDRKTATCPVCGRDDVQSRFIGDLEKRLGYGILWCLICNNGGRLSRIQVPNHLEMRDWDDEEVLSNIPEYEDSEAQKTPYD